MVNAEFKGIPFIKITKNIPSYNFLKGDFGKEIFDEYNSRVKQGFGDNPNLKALNFSERIIKGSNSYIIFLMSEILSKYDLRTANSADVQRIINKDENFLIGFDVDLGLVLRTQDPKNKYVFIQDPNKYFAKQLGEQAKDRDYEFSSLCPLVFKPSDLELIVDDNSPSRLGFNIKDSATPFNALELSPKNNNRRFKIANEEYGMPIFDENGNRRNSLADDGLSSFYLGGDLNLGSWNSYLGGSNLNDTSRIVVLNDGEEIAA